MHKVVLLNITNAVIALSCWHILLFWYYSSARLFTT